jgi:hypothetical protein
MKIKVFSAFLLLVIIVSTLASCFGSVSAAGISAESASTDSSASLAFNNSAWKYDSTNDVYYQIGVQYCAKPESTDYETLGIYVPGKYVTAKDNGDGTFTVTVNAAGTVNGYTAATAPIVMPVNTPGYSAQKAPSTYSYNEISSYMQAGFIYVAAGMRGKANGYDASGQLTFSGGAPWGVTDFKAAVRFLRYNKSVLPGDSESIYAFGMSGGGAQTSVIGASGDSALYTPYLESIGAAMTDASGNTLSDAVKGAMAWCPITSLDYADEAYEWNMGQYSTAGTRADGTWTAALSDDMAAAYAQYINQLGLTDENGKALTLTETNDGIYTAGTYYDYLKSVVETSLNNFLKDNTFPYTKTAGGFPGGGMPQGAPAGGAPNGDMPQGAPEGAAPQGVPGGDASTAQASSTTYNTVQDYINALNKDGQWVTYDAASNTATISSIAAFVKYANKATKSVGAFDDLNRSQAENDVFGNDASDKLHFDITLSNLLTANQSKYASLTNWDASVVDAYATDLKAVDKLGNSITYRQSMYNPMFYLLKSYEGYQTSNVAPYWRIRTGIEQGDTASTVEVNLALALKSYSGVNGVDFETVWGQGHTKAERTGESTSNFINWVNTIEKQ